MSELDHMAEVGRRIGALSDDAIDRLHSEVHGDHAVLFSLAFCEAWVDSGCQVYELQHSAAALLAATRAPELDTHRLPHAAFVVKVPSVYLPIEGNASADVLLLVEPTDSEAKIGIWSARERVGEWLLTGAHSIREDDRDVAAHREWLLAVRMVSNVVAYVTEHRECVERVTKEGAPRTVHSVRPPRDVVIDRAFRDRVSALVRAGTQTEVRSALAHMVRGHWRNQPVGEGRTERRLTWVRPHRRGDESLGIVTKRTERIS